VLHDTYATWDTGAKSKRPVVNVSSRFGGISKMKTKKEIRHLLKKWMLLKEMLEEDGDTVSRIVAKQAESYIQTLKWVLE